VIGTPSAREGFEKLGITGYIQGISIGRNDEVYVYGCSGNGALVRFEDVTSSPRWTISYPGGKLSSTEPPRREGRQEGLTIRRPGKQEASDDPPKRRMVTRL
jgi:hypothetical protein